MGKQVEGRDEPNCRSTENCRLGAESFVTITRKGFSVVPSCFDLHYGIHTCYKLHISFCGLGTAYITSLNGYNLSHITRLGYMFFPSRFGTTDIFSCIWTLLYVLPR